MHISDEAEGIPKGIIRPWEAPLAKTVTGDPSVLSVCHFIIQNYPKLLNHAESFWAIVELSVLTENHLQLQADHGSKGAGEASAMSENWKLFMGVVMLGGDGWNWQKIQVVDGLHRYGCKKLKPWRAVDTETRKLVTFGICNHPFWRLGFFLHCKRLWPSPGVFFAGDSFTSQWQTNLYSKFPHLTQLQMMLGGNFLGMVFTSSNLYYSWPKIRASIHLAMDNPDVLQRIVALGVVSALGQFCIYSAIRILGSLSFTWIMTARQLLSVLISLIFFGPGLSCQTKSKGIGSIGSNSAPGFALSSLVLWERGRNRQWPIRSTLPIFKCGWLSMCHCTRNDVLKYIVLYTVHCFCKHDQFWTGKMRDSEVMALVSWNFSAFWPSSQSWVGSSSQRFPRGSSGAGSCPSLGTPLGTPPGPSPNSYDGLISAKWRVDGLGSVGSCPTG